MKPPAKIVACIVFLSVLFTVSSALAQAGKLIGVWKLVEYVETSPNAVTITNGPLQIAIFTKKYMMVMGNGSVTRPELPENATDAQKVAAWEHLRAESCEYEADDTKIKCKALVVKNPNTKTGDVMTFEYRFEGDYLIQIFRTTEETPRTLSFTLKYMRLE